MGEWADKALKRVQNERENKRIQNETFVEKQKVKRELGPQLWSELRTIVKGNCEDFNAKAKSTLLTFMVAPISELDVRSEIDGRHKLLHAEFDERSGILTWYCGQNQGKCEISVTEEGQVFFQGNYGPTTPDLVADLMMNGLL